MAQKTQLTPERARDLIRYYKGVASQTEYEYYHTRDERQNDLHVLALETIEYLQLAEASLYNIEARRRLTTDD